MRWLLYVSVIGVLQVQVSAALACSPVDTDPNQGPLRERTHPYGEVSPLPRNVAFFSYVPESNPPSAIEAEDGTIYPLHVAHEFPRAPPQLNTFLLTTDQPLPARTKFSGLFTFETSDETVNTPPAQPELRSARIEHSDDDEGCGDNGSSCGSMTTLHYDVPESPGVAFFGLYYGNSSEVVTRATEPNQVVVTSLAHLQEAEGRGDRYLAITVFDQAGRESPKSRVIRIENESDGCNAAPRTSGMLQAYGMLAIAAAAARARRLRRTGAPT